ncbi:MAG: T9SS type A sorting domain-containing protein [Ignavibacteriales bacterium]|nr:T9SS type A sorting domain-containing protein [Ignavibacteriales bacterium]
MRKLLLVISLFLFVSGQLNAQLSTNWSFTSGGANLPTWFGTANTERGMTYSKTNNQMLVVVRNGGVTLKALDAQTGLEVTNYDQTGVSGGTFALNDAEASHDDAKVYAANLATSNAAAFKIYKGDNPTTAPTVAFSYTAPVTGTRMGDNLCLVGNNADNSAKFLIIDATRNMVFILKTVDNGNTFQLQDSVQLPALTFGGHPSVFPIMNDMGVIEGLITNSSGKNVLAFNLAGQLIGSIPGGVIATGTTAIKGFNTNNMFYLATYQFGAGNENVRIVHVGDNPLLARTYTVTTSLGANANANGSGDLSFNVRPDGSVDLFILGTNNGIQSVNLRFPFFVNGRFNEHYNYIASKQNTNSGFGAGMELKKIGYSFDTNHVYVAVQGKLDRTNSNGIVVLLNFDNIPGLAAGQSLGGVPGGGHLFGDATNPNWKMGDEVDMAFVINPGGNDSVAYLDAAKYFNGVKTGGFIGSTYNSGSASQGPSAPGIFATNAITFALDSAYDIGRGLELKIPFTELPGINPNSNIQVAAFIVSNTAYFSDLTLPGNLTGGNAGFNPNFGTLPGGPYFTAFYELPVEMVSFSANTNGNSVNLEWITASETNNRGFSVEKSFDGSNFVEVGFVAGKGSSSLMNKYSFTENNAGASVVYYRLRQIDFDGTASYSETIKVEFSAVPAVFALSQNYPNPFNPSTSISFSVAEEGMASLMIYSINGELVSSLFNEAAKPGQLYKVQFNANNLPSGIYFYRLTQGANVVTRKLTLLK